MWREQMRANAVEEKLFKALQEAIKQQQALICAQASAHIHGITSIKAAEIRYEQLSRREKAQKAIDLPLNVWCPKDHAECVLGSVPLDPALYGAVLPVRPSIEGHFAVLCCAVPINSTGLLQSARN